MAGAAGFYKRVLPSPPAIEFASSEGKEIFSEALSNGTMVGFFKLISYFQTQSEPAYCGLPSLAVVLNALEIDPGRKWKGQWRFFDESMLECCEPLEKVKAEGITFGKVARLAQCVGAKVQAFRANETTLADFRRHVINCASSEECHLITSYHRGTFEQTGDGHFSPIGGYHSGRDMALILDVARFKYPPHWVPVPLLWEAMDTIDEATGCPRGFMLVSKLHNGPISLLFPVSCKNESLIGIATYLLNDVPHLLKSDGIDTVQKALSLIFESLPSNVAEFIRWASLARGQEEGSTELSKEEKERLAIKAMVLRQMHEMDLFKCVVDWLSSQSSGICCERAEILSGELGSVDGYCCNKTLSLSSIRFNGDDPPNTVVSGKVITTSNSGQSVPETAAPTDARCCRSSGKNDCLGTLYHAGTDDVLTALLLALPPPTWNSLKNTDVRRRINDMVCVENIPLSLQEEVLPLRQQLALLHRCKQKKVDELDEPSYGQS